MALFSFELRIVAWLMLAWLVVMLLVFVAVAAPFLLLLLPVPVPAVRRRWRR